MIKGSQSGQILLVVVLTMIVALTVGLSIAARIVTELKLSKQNEESQRAFQAAESGIQQTLARLDDVGTELVPIELDNNSNFFTTHISDEGSAIVMNNGLEVDQGVGADVWLSDYSSDPALLFLNPMGGGSPVTITMYWGSPTQDDCNAGSGNAAAPAIEVALLKGPVSNPTIQKSIFEAAGCGRINNSVSSTSTGGPFTLNLNGVDVQFRNRALLQFGTPLANLSNGLIMKVIPIYNSTVIGFQSTQPAGNPYLFPAQGSVVNSTGKSGDTVRKVTYYQSYPQLPLEVFPYSLISQ